VLRKLDQLLKRTTGNGGFVQISIKAIKISNVPVNVMLCLVRLKILAVKIQFVLNILSNLL
jgi:hypothetical protein